MNEVSDYESRCDIYQLKGAGSGCPQKYSRFPSFKNEVWLGVPQKSWSYGHHLKISVTSCQPELHRTEMIHPSPEPSPRRPRAVSEPRPGCLTSVQSQMALNALGVDAEPSPETVTGKRTGDPSCKQEARSWHLQATRRHDHVQGESWCRIRGAAGGSVHGPRPFGEA